MEIPGSSIFQGAGSFQLNNSANHLEEEEALEDQKRRDEELGNQLQNAFDDLIDDDDYTVDSSSHFQSRFSNGGSQDDPIALNGLNVFNKCNKNMKQNDGNNIGYQQEIEKLNKIIQSKNRELENISRIVHDERKKTDELTKRLALSEAEKCRAEMTKKQTHELLVESKAKCSELDDFISKLKTRIKSLEESNTNLEGDLERVRNMLTDVQHKYHMVEKNVGFTADRHAEILIKQASERNNAQIEMMQQQIDNLRNKLDNKELEVKTIDTRYKELQRSREALLIDKAETINQLSRTLEDSQRQCQQLMSNQDYVQENVRLQRLVASLQTQTDDMQKTINNLTARLESTTAELNIVDSILQENNAAGCNADINSPRRLSLTKANLVGSTPLSTNDRLGNLKTELYRCMSSQKTKRDDIRKLHEQLANKNAEIKSLKDVENTNLVKITTYKEEKDRLENRLQNLESELDEMKSLKTCDNENQVTELQQKIEKTENQLKIVREMNEGLIDDKNKLQAAVKLNETERKRFDSQLKNFNIDLEELKQEHESLKLNYDRVCKDNEQLKRRESYDPLRLELEKQKYLLKDAQKEGDRIKNLYVEISNVKEDMSIELAQLKAADLYKELQHEKSRCVSFERALQLAELKCSETMKILEMEKTTKEQEICQLKDQIAKEKMQNLIPPENCLKCTEQISELTKFEIQNMKLENQCSVYQREIQDLQVQLQQSHENIAALNEKICLKLEQDNLIAELKDKAQQFENFIKSQNSSNSRSPSNCGGGGNSTSGISSPKDIQQFKDQCVETTSLDFQNQSRRQIETRIRDEMAKIFAIELKNMEEKFKVRLNEFETQNKILKEDLHQINSILKLRQNEVQILKHAILSERDKTNEIFQKKDADAQQHIQKQTVMLHKCRDELNLKQRRIDEMISELEERNQQIEGERQSMKAVMTQWEEQRLYQNNTDTDWIKVIGELKKDQFVVLDSLKKKYESAKKTANNYKRYAEEKEKHMLHEYERIKAEYALAKSKLEARYNEFVERKSKEMKMEISNIKLEYDKKLTNSAQD